MKKYEPWAIAAIYLMQSVNGKEHYTNIVNYILETELTDLTEKSAANSRAVNEILNQKVVDGHAIFQSDGNGYYSLTDKDVTRKIKEIQDVIQYLKGKKLEINLLTHEDEEKDLIEEDEMLGGVDEKLRYEARKFSEESRKLSDEARKISDEVGKLSDENKKLREENKKLREENKKLREEKQQLNEKLQSIKQLCE